MSDSLWEQAQRLHASRLFGTRSPEHAYALILVGREVGVGPTTALTQIAVIQGKPAFGAALVGALVRKSPRYDYDVTELTDDRVSVAFFERSHDPPTMRDERRLLGTSTFTLQDAQRAGLGGSPTWQRFPRNLLLARALTNGARWYCPDVLAGAAYTPDELEALPPGPDEVVVEPLGGPAPSLDDLIGLHGLEAVLEAGGGVPPSTPEEIADLAERLAIGPAPAAPPAAPESPAPAAAEA